MIFIWYLIILIKSLQINIICTTEKYSKYNKLSFEQQTKTKILNTLNKWSKNENR